MSEQVPERSSGGGNVFTRKLGPLPMWGWMAIALLLAVFYYLYKKNQSGSASMVQGSTAATGANSASVSATDASLIPQFVNQVYENETPPPAPNVTVNNTVPASTTPSSPTIPYGGAGPATIPSGYQAITPAEAQILMSNKNIYNPAKGAAQRPYIFNGTSLVPNTNPISPNYQYYAGPLEVQEIAKYTASHPNPASGQT